jgi:urea transporter
LTEIGDGLWGFNASLTLIGIEFFFVITRTSLTLASTAAVVATLLQAALFAPSFTLPFCLGASVVLVLQGSVPRLYVVKLEELTTPEQHLLTLRTLRAIAVARRHETIVV